MMISVIIPTHRRHKELARLLASIEAQKTDDLHYEVIVASNFFEPEIKKLVDRVKGLTLVYQAVGQSGVNYARNLGIQLARGDILVFFDDDCLLTDVHYLHDLLFYHRVNPHAAGIGGVYQLNDKANRIEKVYHAISDFWLRQSVVTSFVSTNLVGGNASYKREMLRDIRFDENLFFGGSELSFNRELAEKGYELLLIPDLQIVHLVKMNLAKLLVKGYLQGKGAAKQKQKTQSGHRASLGALIDGFGFVERIYFIIYQEAFLYGFLRGQPGSGWLKSFFIYITQLMRRLRVWASNHPLVLDVYFSLRYVHGEDNE